MYIILLLILAQEGLAIKSPLRIYGGINATSDEFTYAVRIEVQGLIDFKNGTIIAQHFHTCTASALSPVWLLSAAHCLTVIKEGIPVEDELTTPDRDLTIKMVIRYGHVENSQWVKYSFSDVLFTVRHPLYIDSEMNVGNNNIKNDIGLLKVTPLNMMSYIKLSAVDYQTMFGHQVIIAGFGITTKTDNDGRIKTDDTLNLMKPLQVLKVIITKCNHLVLVPALCSAARCIDVNSACNGDSGGPVIHPSGVIGVLSMAEFTRYCGQPTTRKRVDVPAYITSVSPYIEWISSYVTGAKLFNASNQA